MALLGNFDQGYTKSGGNMFTRWSNAASYIPIPLVSPALTAFFGYVGTAVDAAGWLFRGKFLSAATVAAAGIAGTTVNAAASAVSFGGPVNPVWWLNAGSGITTGQTLGTHARALTESAVGAVTGALGVKPQVLRAYPAGIGSTGAAAMPQGPGRFVSQVAQSRGEDPNAAYARLQSGQPEHMAALEAARAQQTSQGLGV